MEKALKQPSYADGLNELRKNLANMMPENVLQVFDNDADELARKHKSVLKLAVGEKAPSFSLSNAVGDVVHLDDLLQSGKVVLVFYRGTWCPYCNLQLQQYQQILPEIASLGATLVAVSPQTPDESLNIKEKNELQFEVLSDNGNIVANQFTAVFKNADAPLNTMASLGIDFDAHYSDDAKELPVPAVFIIGEDSVISFAKTEGGDYRGRVEAAEIIAALKG